MRRSPAVFVQFALNGLVTHPGVVLKNETIEPAIVVTTIHGTFAKDAEWVTEQSALAHRLAREFGPRIMFRPYRWSGENSHAARIHAGESLRAALHATMAEHSGAKHFLIAHSHGGNVALYALADDDLARRVSGLVCLATPFLHVAARDLRNALAILLQAIAITVIVGAFGLPFLGLWLLVRGHGDLGAWALWGGFGMLVGMRILSEFPPKALLGWMTQKILRLIDRLGMAQRTITAQLRLPDERPYKLLCVAVRGDEARRGLGIIDLLSAVPFVLLKGAGEIMEMASGISDAAAELTGQVQPLIRSGRAMLGAESSGIELLAGVAVLLVSAVLIPPLFALLLVVAAIALCLSAPFMRRFPWGEEFRTGIMSDVSVRARPAGSTELTGFREFDVGRTLHGRPWWQFGRRLAHCAVYEDAEVLDAVSGWLGAGCPVTPVPSASARRRFDTGWQRGPSAAERFGAFVMAVVAVSAVVMIAWFASR